MNLHFILSYASDVIRVIGVLPLSLLREFKTLFIIPRYLKQYGKLYTVYVTTRPSAVRNFTPRQGVRKKEKKNTELSSDRRLNGA